MLAYIPAPWIRHGIGRCQVVWGAESQSPRVTSWLVDGPRVFYKNQGLVMNLRRWIRVGGWDSYPMF